MALTLSSLLAPFLCFASLGWSACMFMPRPGPGSCALVCLCSRSGPHWQARRFSMFLSVCLQAFCNSGRGFTGLLGLARRGATCTHIAVACAWHLCGWQFDCKQSSLIARSLRRCIVVDLPTPCSPYGALPCACWLFWFAFA